MREREREIEREREENERERKTRERDRDSVTNLHIPSEAIFFRMFLTHYVLLGIFMFLCPDFLFSDY